MTPESRKYVETKITQWLAANHPTIPIKLPNVPFQEPNKGGTYLRLRYMHGDPVRSNIGPHAYTIEPKVMQLEALVRDDTGTNTAYDIVRDALRENFHELEVELSGEEVLRFYTSGISAEGNEGNYYRVIGSGKFDLRIRL